MPLPHAGQRIMIVDGGVYLSKWLKVGDRGVILERLDSKEEVLYRCDFHGEPFILAPTEFQVCLH